MKEKSPKLQNKNKVASPVLIRVLAWYLILVGVLSALSILLTGGAFGYPRAAWNGILKLVSAISGYGFLQLKWWGPCLYFLCYVTGTIVFFALPPSQEALELYSTRSAVITLITIPALIAILIILHRKRFSR